MVFMQFLTIQKLINQENLQFNLKRLLLDTGLRKRELPGIAFLLNACPQLEQLVIIFLNRQPEFQVNVTNPTVLRYYFLFLFLFFSFPVSSVSINGSLFLFAICSSLLT